MEIYQSYKYRFLDGEIKEVDDADGERMLRDFRSNFSIPGVKKAQNFAVPPSVPASPGGTTTNETELDEGDEASIEAEAKALGDEIERVMLKSIPGASPELVDKLSQLGIVTAAQVIAIGIADLKNAGINDKAAKFIMKACTKAVEKARAEKETQ